jgi:hypothetical protein
MSRYYFGSHAPSFRDTGKGAKDRAPRSARFTYGEMGLRLDICPLHHGGTDRLLVVTISDELKEWVTVCVANELQTP